ncbi:tRNA1(Val) (adenine(37)-N6)-methyltransferase [Catenovulum sediminis]|uniref:tRNA1(Val) (adenine(37)-N6)-methyltransferase n=1 Tax=Catenovulum sediminis TaxID=1740262 RepID=UPI001180F717|nr:methyltransferase [Catenovulum sediminis]
MAQFRCKQFLVEQKHCGMKVSTDSLILGSWSNASCLPAGRVLDIGAGTGILSLMLAQKTADNVEIHAVEIEKNAILDCQKNFYQSKWSQRLRLLHTDIKALATDNKYQWIISNPPYYTAGQKFETQRMLARHQQELTFQQLLTCVSALITQQGSAEFILPYANLDCFVKEASKLELHLVARLNVKTVEDKNEYKLACLRFSKNKTEYSQDELVIYQQNKQYTKAYKALCQPYYLNF